MDEKVVIPIVLVIVVLIFWVCAIKCKTTVLEGFAPALSVNGIINFKIEEQPNSKSRSASVKVIPVPASLVKVFQLRKLLGTEDQVNHLLQDSTPAWSVTQQLRDKRLNASKYMYLIADALLYDFKAVLNYLSNGKATSQDYNKEGEIKPQLREMQRGALLIYAMNSSPEVFHQEDNRALASIKA